MNAWHGGGKKISESKQERKKVEFFFCLFFVFFQIKKPKWDLGKWNWNGGIKLMMHSELEAAANEPLFASFFTVKTETESTMQ